MADITEERLREIASSDPLVLAICAKMGEPSWADVRAIAAELLAARAEVERLRGVICEYVKAIDDNACSGLDLEAAQLRYEHAVEALRAETNQ